MEFRQTVRQTIVQDKNETFLIEYKTHACKIQTHLSRQHGVYGRARVQIEFPKHFASVLFIPPLKL